MPAWILRVPEMNDIRTFASCLLRTGLTPSTSAPDWAHPAYVCIGTGLAPPTSAPGQLRTRNFRFEYVFTDSSFFTSSEKRAPRAFFAERGPAVGGLRRRLPFGILVGSTASAHKS